MPSSNEKIVPISKKTEWKGLDRISVIVHAMDCIWREQEKDDIGVDGEIELCEPRTEGKGFIGTGKIIKVQSKSGSSYITRNQEDSFESPVKEKDLVYWGKLNLPIVYIVFHPDDNCLYWKDVQAYIRENPDAFEKPHKINFDKETDRFDEEAFGSLCQLCKQAPERVDSTISEQLFSNFLEVVKLPEYVFLSSVVPEKRTQFSQRLTGFIPPYIFREGILTTLTDPSKTQNALTHVIDGEAERLPFLEWFDQSPDSDNDTRILFNALLTNHLHLRKLYFNRKTHKYFYRHGLTKEKPIKKKWRNNRTNRSPTRIVAQYYEYGDDKFFLHKALSASFQCFGTQWGIIIEPKVFYTHDTLAVWRSDRAKSYAIRYRSREYNSQYLVNILFWAFILSDDRPTFSLDLDGQSIIELKGYLKEITAPFGIRTIKID